MFAGLPSAALSEIATLFFVCFCRCEGCVYQLPSNLDKAGCILQRPSFALLMEQCQSLKALNVATALMMITTAGVYSRPGETVSITCQIHCDAAATALANNLCGIRPNRFDDCRLAVPFAIPRNGRPDKSCTTFRPVVLRPYRAFAALISTKPRRIFGMQRYNAVLLAAATVEV
jgi:hypothetical protein